MNKPVTIDASAHYSASTEEKPSLLVLILDTNPFAWSTLSPQLPLKTALAHILLFINAHLSFSHANRVAVLASHSNTATFLHPPPPSTSATPPSAAPTPEDATRDANKYRLFREVEHDVQNSLRALLAATSPDDLAATPNDTMMAGALSLALAYINRATRVDAADTGVAVARPGEAQRERASMSARILVVSVSGDLASQYVSVMNSIFAAQRGGVAIDVAKITGETVFLQQASEATGGIYLQLQHPEALLQYLLTCFIADPATRKHLVSPSQINVDFRAACFCHKRVVDVGFVCSICLSSQCCPYVPLLREARKEQAEEARREAGEQKKKEEEEEDHAGGLATMLGRLDVADRTPPIDTAREGRAALLRWWQDVDSYCEYEAHVKSVLRAELARQREQAQDEPQQAQDQPESYAASQFTGSSDR
ncbi:transcription factor Tfb4-domain-containing protein [Geopyxis carbonaria]|nr:transcription factor Tfb4-domain-containing protein [Geopyxis carbonaria]